MWYKRTENTPIVCLTLRFLRQVLSDALPFVLVFLQSCLALWSPRFGKGQFVYVLLVHLLVYFACANLCPFSLSLGVRYWLRLVIVALPGHFYYSFFNKQHSSITVTWRQQSQFSPLEFALLTSLYCNEVLAMFSKHRWLYRLISVMVQTVIVSVDLCGFLLL